MSAKTRKLIYILIAASLAAIICLTLPSCQKGNGNAPTDKIPGSDVIPGLDKVFNDMSEYLKQYEYVSEITDYSKYEFKDTNEVFAAFAYASARSVVYAGDITAELNSRIEYSDKAGAEVLRRETTEQYIAYSKERGLYAFRKSAIGESFLLSGNQRNTSLNERLSVVTEEDDITAYSYASSLPEEDRFTKFKVDNAWMANKLADRISSALRILDGAKGLGDFINSKAGEGYGSFDVENSGDEITLSLVGDSGTIEEPSEIFITAKGGFITGYRALTKGEVLYEEEIVDFNAEYNFKMDFGTPITAEIYGVKEQYRETRLKTYVNFVSYTTFDGFFGDPLALPALDNNDEAVFLGWYFDEALSKKCELTSFPSIDVTLYPKWKERE